MQKCNFLCAPPCLQRHAQAAGFARHDLGILGVGIVKRPAAGAAQGIIPHHAGIVMQDVHGIKAVFCQVALHLAGGRPPIIMVAFQQPFLTRQVLDKRKVGFGVLQLHGPAGIPRQNDCILRGDQRAPVCFQLGQIAFPAFKNIHRLIPAERKVKITNHKNCHMHPRQYILVYSAHTDRARKSKRFCALPRKEKHHDGRKRNQRNLL